MNRRQAVDRGAVPGPRRVQADQRQLRPRRRRPPADRGRPTAAGCLRPEDTIARLGGDEFTVLLEDIADVRYAIRVAERIAEALKRAVPRSTGTRRSVTASIGIAVSTGRESTPDELMRNSDRAMYQAKRNGKARFVVFHEALADETVRRSRGAAEPSAEAEEPVETSKPRSSRGSRAASAEEPTCRGAEPVRRAEDAEIEIHREPVPDGAARSRLGWAGGRAPKPRPRRRPTWSRRGRARGGRGQRQRTRSAARAARRDEPQRGPAAAPAALSSTLSLAAAAQTANRSAGAAGLPSSPRGGVAGSEHRWRQPRRAATTQEIAFHGKYAKRDRNKKRGGLSLRTTFSITDPGAAAPAPARAHACCASPRERW